MRRSKKGLMFDHLVSNRKHLGARKKANERSLY
jgi:hypothetical protein